MVDTDGGVPAALALAIVFGLASIPWTYAFEQVPALPLWPAFIASATYFSTRRGLDGLVRGLAGNLVGAAYGLATLAAVSAFGWGHVGLSVLVGVGMFVAGLHAFVGILSFTPAGFLGYATAFSVEAAGMQLGAAGLIGASVATALSMGIGAGIGWLVDQAAGDLSRLMG